ncbi:BrnA antitoxin family protein [uncultured Methylobacterium sp.]|uniref:BrnA antitoxin family protein n=1 Tax=uncultured Methylobacterium sp. TaxID=157278 RepID=UPI002595B5EE|nr:BrnA antitoxin family protein [uncultured Methylobacterium sp.]
MPSSKALKGTTGRTDWDALRAMSEDVIERIALADEDNPATDESHWAEATIFRPTETTDLHAKFDRDVVEFFRSGGPDYVARMNAVLRYYMQAQQAKKTDR